ncbi:MAG: group III truncated hemoglobin [Chthoniobacter sp.]|uniref:group III truncated hemoglobin n=1 Tax=Chthoniobacter sp. TaxID=2510640 RepID=UPI0032AA9C66
MNLRDISTATDIQTLVDSFYDRVGRDELLAPIFNDVAHVDWATHLPIMYRFWESMLFGAGTYEGAPFPKHAVLPVQKEHFVRWLALFVETVNAHFAGPKAEEAKGRAASIADTFAQRMGLLKDASGLGPSLPVRAATHSPRAC